MICRTSLLTSSAVALVLCIAPASAQTQQKEGPGMPGGSATGGEGRAAKEQSPGKDTSQRGVTQGDTKGQQGKSTTQAEPQGKSKGAAESQSKEPTSRGSAQNQPMDQRGKGSAQTQQQQPKGSAETQPKEPGARGSAQTQPKEQGTKGSAQKQPAEQGNKGSAQTQQPKDDVTKGASKSEASGGRAQLSEQQRTSVHQTIHKESNVNRINQVNFSVNVGTRVPRSVHLVALPATVISLVPQYRSYRYFVANDQICIVDPNSYEIVEVIAASDRTARADDRGGSAKLLLTEEEKTIILREVEMDGGGSTMGLGALAEGAELPRDVQLRTFPQTVIRQVPKVEGYKYFTAENRVAIADPQGSKVQLVIEARR